MEGLLIAGVDKSTPAAAAELQRGMVISSIDGQAAVDILTAAKRVYAKAKGEKVKLELTIPVQRGAFVRLTQGSVDLPLR